MPKRFPTLILAVCIFGGCAPAPAAATLQSPSETISPPTDTPAPTAASWSNNSQDCYYEWATQELPGLSRRIQSDLRRQDPGIVASAYAFGEDCRHQDGSSTFLPMETDFRVRIPVASLSDEVDLGGWITRVMQAVEALPASEMAGTRPGRVEFEFSAEAQESLRMIVELSRYLTEGADLTGAELFQHFRLPQ